jgi:mannose/fructose/N-acetylgalactosamine-specific phosphotransferase system component IID
MKRTPIALSLRHQWWLYGTLTILLVTGLVWAALHYYFRTGEDEINAWEPRLLKVHGAAAMLALLMLGTLVPLHIKRAWHARKNRLSGACMIGWFGIVTITGYGLYYSGGDKIREWTS